MRYFIDFCYDGTAYAGMQRQPNALSIQEVLEDVLSQKYRQEIAIVAAGRTDAGVHAHSMFAHFDVLENTFVTKEALNAFLPNDIVVRRIYKVKEDAHARFDALSREYKYYISLDRDPFYRHYSWHYTQKNLNIVTMNEAANKLFEYIDFTSFAKLHTDVKTNNCTIYEAYWQGKNNQLIFTIKADRFLRNMVRSIVGTLLRVGKGTITVNDFCTIIEAKDRNKAGVSVPAKGLFLHEIIYPQDIFYEK